MIPLAAGSMRARRRRCATSSVDTSASTRSTFQSGTVVIRRRCCGSSSNPTGHAQGRRHRARGCRSPPRQGHTRPPTTAKAFAEGEPAQPADEGQSRRGSPAEDVQPRDPLAHASRQSGGRLPPALGEGHAIGSSRPTKSSVSRKCWPPIRTGAAPTSSA